MMLAQLHIMDLCVYNHNLHLLKIFSRYGTKISYIAILYCLEKDMIDFICYFISGMKIECYKQIYYFCVMKNLVGSLDKLIDQLVYRILLMFSRKIMSAKESETNQKNREEELVNMKFIKN